jgi:hypothetical protein
MSEEEKKEEKSEDDEFDIPHYSYSFYAGIIFLNLFKNF